MFSISRDKADAELVRRSLERKEEAIPAVVANRIFAGENPVKAFREWRGMTQEELAKAAGTSAAYLSQIETGVRNAGSAMRRRLGLALRVDASDLASS
jgi:DNA-binding XRE family transcriptional regulator